ncbi:unnamed protein product, partial [marine sediment metagenome]
YDNFNYRLDYERKKDKMIHFLSLGRYSAPQSIVYEKDDSPLDLAIKISLKLLVLLVFNENPL